MQRLPSNSHRNGNRRVWQATGPFIRKATMAKRPHNRSKSSKMATPSPAISKVLISQGGWKARSTYATSSSERKPATCLLSGAWWMATPWKGISASTDTTERGRPAVRTDCHYGKKGKLTPEQWSRRSLLKNLLGVAAAGSGVPESFHGKHFQDRSAEPQIPRLRGFLLCIRARLQSCRKAAKKSGL